jgi:hypothetical protein
MTIVDVVASLHLPRPGCIACNASIARNGCNNCNDAETSNGGTAYSTTLDRISRQSFVTFKNIPNGRHGEWDPFKKVGPLTVFGTFSPNS